MSLCDAIADMEAGKYMQPSLAAAHGRWDHFFIRDGRILFQQDPREHGNPPQEATIGLLALKDTYAELPPEAQLALGYLAEGPKVPDAEPTPQDATGDPAGPPE